MQEAVQRPEEGVHCCDHCLIPRLSCSAAVLAHECREPAEALHQSVAVRDLQARFVHVVAICKLDLALLFQQRFADIPHLLYRHQQMRDYYTE